MPFSLTSQDYLAVLDRFSQRLEDEKEYITDLDAATGDGDHWANMSAGFASIAQASPDLSRLPMPQMLRQTGMLLMSKIGGSSGALYGSAYLEAAKVLSGCTAIGRGELGPMLRAMMEAIMRRGASAPNQKTMVDTLAHAAAAYEEGVADQAEDGQLLLHLKDAARRGAEATRDMEAIRGRAYYQANKGVGHLDPGAVTMAYQIGALADYALEQLDQNTCENETQPKRSGK